MHVTTAGDVPMIRSIATPAVKHCAGGLNMFANSQRLLCSPIVGGIPRFTLPDPALLCRSLPRSDLAASLQPSSSQQRMLSIRLAAVSAATDPVLSSVADPHSSVSSVHANAQHSQPGKKVHPPPTFVPPGELPPASDETAWLNNALLIDKPLEWTSFGVCSKLRGALGVKKIGHAGTLDPLATGLLIVCTGKGTKSVESFMAQEKVYTGVLRLGQATPSYDAETAPTEERPWRHLSEADLQAAAAAMTGDLMQTPPMFSAIKVKGVKLYHAARLGEEVQRAARPIVVSEYSVWREEPHAQDVSFRVRCSKGTYIRSLAHDLGQSLGSAAHLRSLRREAIGDFSVEDAWDFQQLLALATQRKAEQRAAQQQFSEEHG